MEIEAVESIGQEMEAVNQMLKVAEEYGLITEVVYWSLKYMKEDPKVTPLEALALGMTEWVR